ncbi:hypothetical protein L484_003149 [Morus notabilis]|uniref:GH18 domain-containing protein n=1 Tax=Morus notabilis TaxID=981085 RepID=W9S435_9ROSA|nr:hypothetical protein L484_003149 [Morus notabilis]
MAGFKQYSSPNYCVFIVASLTFAATGCLAHHRPPSAVKAAYYPSWTTSFPASAINTSLFTHIFYAFLAPSNLTFKLEISNSTSISLGNFTSTLRYADPPVKALFSVGGEGSGDHFVSMASEASSRRIFIKSSIEVARKYVFDGVDLDWEFPLSPNEMKLLGRLMKEFRNEIKKEAHLTSRPALLLTAAVYFSSDSFLSGVPRSYPAALMAKSLDWINAMCYDYNGAWSNITGPNAGLFDPSSNVNTVYGLKSWIRAGMPLEKIVMGLPLYGRTWHLKDPNVNRIGAMAVSPGPGNGMLSFFEVDNLVKENGAKVVYDVDTVSVYTVVNWSWVAFDDALTITTKIGFAQALGLRGYFFWALSFDKECVISTQGNFFGTTCDSRTLNLCYSSILLLNVNYLKCLYKNDKFKYQISKNNTSKIDQ